MVCFVTRTSTLRQGSGRGTRVTPCLGFDDSVDLSFDFWEGPSINEVLDEILDPSLRIRPHLNPSKSSTYTE